MATNTDNWIKQKDGVEIYTKHKGLDGKIIITTAHATIIELDGVSTIEKLLISTGNSHTVDQVDAGTAKLLDSSGEKLSLNDVPDLLGQVLITNVTKAA